MILLLQIFDFGFEEENKIDRMKELIINEVSSFREEVRAEARATGPIRRQDRLILFLYFIDFILIFLPAQVLLFPDDLETQA